MKCSRKRWKVKKLSKHLKQNRTLPVEMVSRCYAAVVGRSLPPVSKSAPEAPGCPKYPTMQQKTLDIQNQPGTSTDNVFKKVCFEHKIRQEFDWLSISDHQADLARTSARFRNVMKRHFPGSKCWITGSFAAGLDIYSSDVDFTVEVPSLSEDRKIMKLSKLEGVFMRLKEYESVYMQRGATPILKLVDMETKVLIDVSIDNSDAKRNTQILNYYAQMDSRFPLLCKAVKLWASKCGVEGAKNGRLNSFSLCLMVVHYLQVIQPVVLPNLQELFPELNGDLIVEDDEYQRRNLKKEIEDNRSFDFNQNRSNVAVLFMDLLKYYSNFDFVNKWISVKRGRAIEKRWNNGNKREPLDGMPICSRFIVVEDPFLVKPRNCAVSVGQLDYVERIQLEFRLEYERILQKHTIFNLHESPLSRRITNEGKKRDLQLIEWKQCALETQTAQVERRFPWEWQRRLNVPAPRPRPESYWELDSTQKWKLNLKAEPCPWPALKEIYYCGF